MAVENFGGKKRSRSDSSPSDSRPPKKAHIDNANAPTPNPFIADVKTPNPFSEGPATPFMPLPVTPNEDFYRQPLTPTPLVAQPGPSCL